MGNTVAQVFSKLFQTFVAVRGWRYLDGEMATVEIAVKKKKINGAHGKKCYVSDIFPGGNISACLADSETIHVEMSIGTGRLG